MKEQYKEGLYRFLFAIASAVICLALAVAFVVTITNPATEITFDKIAAATGTIFLDFGRALLIFAVILAVPFSFIYIICLLDRWSKKK